MRNRLLRLIPLMLVAIMLGMMVHAVLFVNYIVDGKSMEPSFDDGNTLEVNRIAYNLHEAKRFDVIVFHANENEDFVKRIIALPGETIEFRDDSLFVDGKQIEEPFLKNRIHDQIGQYTEDFTLKEKTGKQTVPPNAVFVMGDNRPDSYDSRAFGFVEKEQIVGKVNRHWTESKKPSNVWQSAIIPLFSLWK
ncbi:signal peptidase I [Aciduricibacillus chroicocephali]|uniref:Signal peptidase I n=1 Tax=Aciduricibacillus chroicocephali TaxID=3054939 RepID=A0ABY9KXL2_9BACI|nr:signal peptidase I [Bacillaceae bacterium 44XB]